MLQIPLPNESVRNIASLRFSGLVVASQWFYEAENETGEGSQALVLTMHREAPYYKMMILTYVQDIPFSEINDSQYFTDLSQIFREDKLYTGWITTDDNISAYRNIVEAALAYENF